MDLVDSVTLLRRRWLLVVLVMATCIAGAVGATKLQTKVYSAQTRLIVNAVHGIPRTGGVSGSQLAAQRALTLAQIATTQPAVTAAIDEATAQDGPFSTDAVPHVSASASGSDPFVSIVVKSSDPHLSQDVANAYATVLPAVAVRLDQATKSSSTALAAVEPAGLPRSPSSPRPRRNLLIGILLGVLLGVGLAALYEAFDRRLWRVDEVEQIAGVSVLGTVPREYRRARAPVLTHPMSRRAEAYRTVRTNLTFASASGMPKTILITSPLAGEGKTTLAVNLALACGRTGQSVALVDADFRRAMIAEYLGVSTGKGLSDLLAEGAPVDSVVVKVDEGRIDVVTSGPMLLNPSEALGSAHMTRLLGELKAAHDVVIIDAPPALLVADALVLAAHAEAVVLVVKLGSTNRAELGMAREAVLKVNANLVGIVANASTDRVDRAYGYSYRHQPRRATGPALLRSRRARKPEIVAPPGQPGILSKRPPEPAYEYFGGRGSEKASTTE